MPCVTLDQVKWQLRLRPLHPEGLFVPTLKIATLRARLLRPPTESAGASPKMRAQRYPCGLVLLATGEELPWIEGALYLGREPQSPTLYMPTLLDPSCSSALLTEALRPQLLQAQAEALILLPDLRLILPFGAEHFLDANSIHCLQKSVA